MYDDRQYDAKKVWPHELNILICRLHARINVCWSNDDVTIINWVWSLFYGEARSWSWYDIPIVVQNERIAIVPVNENLRKSSSTTTVGGSSEKERLHWPQRGTEFAFQVRYSYCTNCNDTLLDCIPWSVSASSRPKIDEQIKCRLGQCSKNDYRYQYYKALQSCNA